MNWSCVAWSSCGGRSAAARSTAGRTESTPALHELGQAGDRGLRLAEPLDRGVALAAQPVELGAVLGRAEPRRLVVAAARGQAEGEGGQDGDQGDGAAHARAL
jgi:hypothetical protein